MSLQTHQTPARTLDLPLFMKIAHIIASLEARRGGPSRSSLGLAKGLAAKGDEVELLTTGTAVNEEILPGLSIRTFERGAPQQFSPSSALRTHLNAGTYDVLHHHGLWLRTLHYAFKAASSRAVPLVLSPRGMMAPWAWNHHRRRKQFANVLVHPGALEGVTGWHATSEMEADDIRNLGFRQPICVAPNGVTLPTDPQLQIAREFWLNRVPEIKEHKVGLFYSRLHSKKRVVELMDLWRKLAPPDWLLLVVGIPDQFSVAQLKAQVLREGSQHRIKIFDGTYQPPPYAVADLFLLPSHSENFGLVIAEAMAAGVPVLTTTTTPWTELNARDAGWCVEYGEFDHVMKAALEESPAVLSRRGALGQRWMKESFTWEVVAETLHNFYRELHRIPA